MRTAVFTLLLSCLVSAQDVTVPWKGPDQSIYVVTRNHYAEGYSQSVPTPRFGDLIMIEVYSPPHQQNPYVIGQSYALFRGGAPAGHVKIDHVGPLQCDSSAAIVSLTDSGALPAKAIALATNAISIRPHANAQSDATAQERLLAQQIAQNEFRKAGAADASAETIRIDRLISAQIDASSRRVLIGFLLFKTKTAQHELFLIADPADGRVAFSRYHKTSDVEDGKDSQPLRFADQLDLDGDGVDELVVEVTGYESEEFWIYQRQNGLWRRVWVGGQGGC